jgi:acetyl-CoA acetyltransferase
MQEAIIVTSARTPIRTLGKAFVDVPAGQVGAFAAGRFNDEIAVPTGRGEPLMVSGDEQPRVGTSGQDLARLRPAFTDGGDAIRNGRVTACVGGGQVAGHDQRLGIRLRGILRTPWCP